MMRAARPSHGLTLLEVLIAVAIVAVLASIALPSYRLVIAKAARNDAAARLLEVAARQEQFYFTANRYGDLTELGYSEPLYSRSEDHQIIVVAFGAHAFQLVARYRHRDSEHERCTTLTIDHLGQRSSIGSDPDCWPGQR